MTNLKLRIQLSLWVICVFGSVACIWVVARGPSPSSSESLVVSVLLFVLSSISSIIVGHYYARISTSEKIDTIAERSAEKMINLTAQIDGLSAYLEENPDAADEEPNVYAAINAYKHRCQGAALLARSLSSSNDVFSRDWHGVASPVTSQKIEQRFDALKARAESTNELERLKAELSRLDDSQGELARQVHTRMQELRSRIAVPGPSLPIVPSVVSAPVVARAVEVEQISETASPTLHSGVLEVSLLRSVHSATGTGKLDPAMNAPPQVEVELVDGPESLNRSEFSCRSNTGTTFDFPVLFRSQAMGLNLPVGKYRFRYRATPRTGVTG